PPDYLAARAKLISATSRVPEPTPAGNPFAYQPNSASRMAPPSDGLDRPAQHGHTTHFSIIDKWGTVVSFTSTVTDGFGSGIMVPGYGFLLNDRLSNFNLTPRANPTTGDRVSRNPAPRPALGSASSIGVDLRTFTLEGAADRSRIPEARSIVLRRR